MDWSKITLTDITKIDFSKVNEKGYSAMHYLAANGNASIVEAAIKTGANANMNIADKQGHTPLDHATAHGNLKVSNRLSLLGAKHRLPLKTQNKTKIKDSLVQTLTKRRAKAQAQGLGR